MRTNKRWHWLLLGIAAVLCIGTVYRQIALLKDLDDVSNTAPINGEVLKYVSATGLWTPGTDSSSGSTLTNTFDANQFTLVNGTNVHFSPGALVTNLVAKQGAITFGTNGSGQAAILNLAGTTEYLNYQVSGSTLLFIDGPAGNVSLGDNILGRLFSVVTTNLDVVTIGNADSSQITVTAVGTTFNNDAKFDNALLAASGTITNSLTNLALTASQAVVSDANKVLASVPYTGSGNVMRTRTGLYRHLWVDAGAMVAASTNGAATGTYTPAGSDNMTVDVYDFDQTTDEGAEFKLALPDEWGLGTVKVKVYWTAASGTGDVIWTVAGGAFSNDDAFGAGLGTAQSVTDTLIAANDNHISAATAAITIGGTPALADLILFKVTRDADNVGDTLAADARLLGISIQYQESTTEPSAW